MRTPDTQPQTHSIMRIAFEVASQLPDSTLPLAAAILGIANKPETLRDIQAQALMKTAQELKADKEYKTANLKRKLAKSLKDDTPSNSFRTKYYWAYQTLKEFK